MSTLEKAIVTAAEAHAGTVDKAGAPYILHCLRVKRLAAPYHSGPSRDWLKAKNPDSPAMARHRVGRW
jgi:(p)ppGpp synthase/HD superfamily hydrolase